MAEAREHLLSLDPGAATPQRKIGRHGVVEPSTRPSAWERFRETFRRYPLWFSASAGVVLLLAIWSVTRPSSSKRLFEEAEFGLEVRSNKQLENVTSMLGRLEDYQFEDISPTLVERLNQWSQRRADMKDSWQLDPFIAEAAQQQQLPQEYLLYFSNIDSLQFPLEDGGRLQEAVWCRNIGNGLGRHGLDDLSLAHALFDWTMRNIQLEDSSEEKSMDNPTRSLLMGRGEPLTRAWIFILLARQQGLDVIMLAHSVPGQPNQYKPWVPALIHEGELYLFDHNLALPIPGPDGAPIATLKQVAADDGLLRNLDIPNRQIRYPVRAEDLQNVVALIEVSPMFVSRRMHRLEEQLAGADRLVLTMRPADIARELAAMEHVKAVRIWEYPFLCMENLRRLYDAQFERTLDADDRQANEAMRHRLAEELQIFNLPGIVETGRRNLDIDPPFIQEMKKKLEEETGVKQQQEKPLPPRISCVLWKGRMLQFRDAGVGEIPLPKDLGSLDEATRGIQMATTHAHGVDRTAATFMQYGRPYERHIERWQEEFREQQRRGMNLDPDQIINRIRRGKQAASVWLGTLAYERNDFETSVEYFRDQILAQNTDGPWSRTARYNLARSLEALGEEAEAAGDLQTAIKNYREAFEVYDQETTTQRHGNLLRASRLGERLRKLTADDDGPAPSEPPMAS